MLRSSLKRAWQVSHGVTILVLQNVFLLVVSLVARVLDNTIVNGVSVWDKPIKFSLSFLAFGPMLLWLFSRVKSTRIVRYGVGVLGWSMVVEGSLIFLQSVRGVASHFNNTTSFNAAVYRGMAAGVGIFSLAGVIMGLLMARKALPKDALGLATKIAVPMMTFGAILAFSMTVPKPGQIEAGGKILGAHTVDGRYGGTGLPLLGWSTEVGDLRVAHFIGLHSLQFVPLVALLLMYLDRRGTLRTTVRVQRQVTALFAAAYGGLILTTFVQAQRNVSVTRVDGVTALSLLLLVALPAIAACLRAILGSRAECAEGPVVTQVKR
jgi:hypothetical protein